MKKILVLLLFFSLASCVNASAQQAEIVKYAATFDYPPVVQSSTGSAVVTFAIANLTYKTSDEKMLWFAYPQFTNLDKSIKNDLPELLIAKGFSVRGPFDSLDHVQHQNEKCGFSESGMKNRL